LSYPADGGGISPRLSGREKPLVSSRDIRRGRVAPRSPLDFVRLRGQALTILEGRQRRLTS